MDHHHRFGVAKRVNSHHCLGGRRLHPQQLVGFVEKVQLKSWILLLIINIMLSFVGSILEPPAAILLLTPLIMPIVYAAGVDPIRFGIIVTVNLAIGTFMPPFGLNLLAAHALFKTPLPELYRGVMPFPYGDVDAYHLCAGDHARPAVPALVNWSSETDAKSECLNVPMSPLAET